MVIMTTIPYCMGSLISVTLIAFIWSNCGHRSLLCKLIELHIFASGYGECLCGHLNKFNRNRTKGLRDNHNNFEYLCLLFTQPCIGLMFDFGKSHTPSNIVF